MRFIIRRMPPFALLAALVALAAFASAACSNDKDASSTNVEVLNAINILDKAGLHDLDTAIANKTIAANATTTYQQLQTIVLVTEWPNSDLKAKAKTLAAVFGDASSATAGATPDQAKASTAAHNAHEAEHDFSHEVWDYLYGKAGIKVSDSGDND
ncbi:MAG: hypothetical protein ABI577_16435 [bacterium]